MMQRLRAWLLERYLPCWCRDSLLEENKRLRQQVSQLSQENEVLHGYIDGMHDGMRKSKIYITREGAQQ